MKVIDEKIIGKTCQCCDAIITPDHDEASQYWDWEDEDGERRYVDDVFACCLECFYDLQENDQAAIADNAALGLDYDYEY